MARYRWITIVEVHRVPENYLRELVEWSYQHALGRLGVRYRARLLESSTAGPALN